MGCICSKGTSEPEEVEKSNNVENNLKDYSVQLVAPTPSLRDDFLLEVGGGDASMRLLSRTASKANGRISNVSKDHEDKSKVEKPGIANHQRWATMEMAANERKAAMSRLVSLPLGAEAEEAAAGWPSWLTSVAGDAIKGWVPRRADSFEKLDKIGQGTYSSVYKARDLETGLAATRGIKFTEPQIKCLAQQMLSGLEHCHSRGVLHRDIKGSNLLINNDGVLKIGDFGLATFYEPDQKQPLTSRVVTLWYRAPELLLGATEYGVAIDLWSTGCIIAELFAGKPIMPGRTEVEQMHKIFKLCGSPSEDFWKKTKLPHATSFKPQQPYKRRIADTFKEFPSTALALVDKLLAIEPENRESAGSALRSEFFTTPPVACNPSALPHYPPSKEFDAKLRDEEKRQRVDALKGRGPESVRRVSRDAKVVPTPEFNAQRNIQGQSNPKSTGYKYMPHQQDSVSGFAMEPPRGARQNGYSNCSSMIHPSSAVGSSLNKTTASTRNKPEFRTQKSHKPQTATDLFNSSSRKEDRLFGKESGTGYVTKSRIHCSGPLVPPGGNMEDMLKEHERQIQQAVRKARAR
ncbi:hypothetical protein M0R45_027038 [Rubus argutus]|uniref:Protein kinase domain-containing protein n=1 Tax=Rubus argutus TaxID=59490 RepID=A0AAW1X119_RUBAR